MTEEHRKLAAILAVDCVGYSAAAERDQTAAARGVAKVRASLDRVANAHGGRIFSTAGDGFMLEFPLASAAADAAIALLNETIDPVRGPPPIRAGAHLGEVLISGEDLLGHGVNVAARLCALAEPNGLIISGTVKTQLQNDLASSFAAMGEVRLSKMRETVEAYAYTPSKNPWRARFRRVRNLIKRNAIVSTAATVIVVALVLTGIVLNRDRRDVVVDKLEPLVYSEREEYHPTLTPDGRFVVYAADIGEDRWNNIELFVRPVAGSESRQLTNTPDLLEYAPAVSPNGDRIAYVRASGLHIRQGYEPCQIMVRSFPDGLDRQVGICEGVVATYRLAWTHDGQGLIYSGNHPLVTGGSAAQVLRLDLSTGETRQLVPSLEDGLGDFRAVVSPNGRRIAFVRYLRDGVGAVHVYDLRTDRLVRITPEVNWAVVDWLDDRRLFVLAGEDTGTELWLRDARASGRARRLLPAIAHFPSFDYAAGVLAVEIARRSQNLVRRGAHSGASVAAGAQLDHSATFSSEGILAFIRVDTHDWLYLQHADTEPRRLARLTGVAASGLQWSPDGRQLAYTSVQDGRARLHTVDAASGVIHSVATPPSHEPGALAWSMDGQSLFYIDKAAGSRIRRIPVGGGTSETISDAAWRAIADTPNGLIATRVFEPGLWRLRRGRDPEALNSLYRPHLPMADRDWVTANGVFYWVEALESGIRRIMATPIEGGAAREVMAIEDEFAGSLAADPTTGDLVYAIATEQQSDIDIIRLRRQ